MSSSSDINPLPPLETWSFRPTFDTSWSSHETNTVIINALRQSISSLTPETPSFHPHTVSSPETETVSKRVIIPPCSKKKITKRKSRPSKRSPTTFINADPENFRQMVQQMTGVRFTPGSVQVGSVVKPEPHRPVVNGVDHRQSVGCILPTLDTSAFLLDHHQHVVGPTVGFGPPSVVADGGEFDGFSSFPTLESWKVM